ncbi:MAG TPA: hypothetical protein VGM96_27315 [Reyranella sp.]|jgi:hypothetical protein
MLRRVLVAPVFLALAACQPQHPPKTATPAPPQGSIDLPATETAHRYDAAIKPGDESRAPSPRTVTAVRRAAPARPPTNALTEREKQAIARWDREEATLSYDAPPLGLRPPPTTGVKLAMPADAALPRPSAERASERAAPVKRDDAALPPPAERPEPVTPAESVKASVPVPPSAPSSPPAPEPATRPEPAAATPPTPPADSAPPQQTAAVAPPIVVPPAATLPAPAPRAPVDTAIPRPKGEPAVTVTFAPRSAGLSDGDRLLLEGFARGTNTRRVRQILLYGYGGASDPVQARQLALARVLAVHAALIDLGLKADIEIGDFSQTSGGAADRVDVMLRQ